MSRLIVSCLLLLVLTSPVPAVIVFHRTDERHERFRDDVAFVGVGIDFTGVGKTSNNAWVTMISDTNFLSSGHLVPSGVVEFRFDNSPLSTAPRANCSIAGSVQIANGGGMPPTDLRFGTIDIASCSFTNMSPTSLPFYEIADFDSSNPLQYDGQIVLQAGVSETTYGTGAVTSFRVGRNRISRTTENETLNISPLGDRKADWAYYADDSAPGDLRSPQTTRVWDVVDPDETYFQGGDSGGPSFLASGKLIGIHSFNGGIFTYDDDGDERRASGDVFLPRYKSQLMALTAVPEPSQWLLISVVLGCIILKQAICRRLMSLR